MTKWRKQVDLGDIFEAYDESNFEATRDATVERLKANGITGAFVGRLARAKTERGFNSALDAMWDWADENYVWIQTF